MNTQLTFVLFVLVLSISCAPEPKPSDFDKFEGKGSLDSLTQKDLRHLANNFVYFGSYEVNESDKTIEHHIKSANFQRMWGTTAKRKYEFNGDTLTLYPLRDKFPKTRLKWVKVNQTDK